MHLLLRFAPPHAPARFRASAAAGRHVTTAAALPRHPYAMKSIRSLLGLLALTFATLGAAAATAPAKPNVIIVLVDDAGYGDFSCHGHPFLQTPHIDKLHAESVRFTDFHVAPMCSPTRGQLLTGAHGLRTGVTSVTSARSFLRPEFVTAPQMFAAAGWRTGLFGKWHLGDSYPHRPMDKGFQTAVWTKGWGFTSAPEFSNVLLDGRIMRGATPGKFPGYITDFCFDEAMGWMRERRAQAEPFFCFIPLHAAHAPHTVPEAKHGREAELESLVEDGGDAAEVAAADLAKGAF